VRDIGLAVRSGQRLRADPTRVVPRLFIPGQEVVGGSESRAAKTAERVLALSEADVGAALEELLERFADRHDDLESVFAAHAERVADYVTSPISRPRRQLLGAVFTHEYSLEGAAVCNPGLITHPDQRGVSPGSLRVILSYRAIGEGHRSSICFRTGSISVDDALTLDEPQPFPVVATPGPVWLNRELFHGVLHDAGLDGETAASVLKNLGERFTESDLDEAIIKLERQSDVRLNVIETSGLLRLIASTFYTAVFDSSVDLSRRVLWPSTPNESQGVEDARFVEIEEAGTARYVASYTAFNGRTVSQQLLETDDFRSFSSSPLAGRGARNKGLAFFPRRVGGRFVALSRHDRESNAVAFSSDLHRWDEVAAAQLPMQPWEIIQLGNCGSPTELSDGWLVITHGVGPMRTYGIGALLLDLDDPSRVVAQLPRPLLLPNLEEQDGYVPNVVYSCGSLVHGGTLYLPYGIADQFISHATVDVAALVGAMERVG
jgi:predicted GH43/DUF377 family glycosyl hydrolase